MPSRHDPADSLADIIENAERIESYLVGIDRNAFAGNGLVRDAIERCLERVCEAANRLGEHAAELMPDQPWGDIRGMGNRLRHAYDRISLDRSPVASPTSPGKLHAVRSPEARWPTKSCPRGFSSEPVVSIIYFPHDQSPPAVRRIRRRR